jgi:twitching motility two-component system response regulator PilG
MNEAAMAEESAGLSDLKVMVIDDSKTIRRTADIIFVDIMMPRLDGYQTCALIKNNSAFRDTPVIMLSSKDSIFDRARGRIVGSTQYLTKPFTKEDLLGAIKEHATGK